MAFSLDAHRELATIANASNRRLQIGFNRRFDPDFAKIARVSLGTPYLLRITSRDPGLPSLDYLRTSGGMFVDMTIHDFDMARFLMHSEVVEVFAFGANLVDERLAAINDIDTAVVTLKFANGAFGVIDNSRQAIYGYDQRVELFGSNGSASNDHHRPHSVTMSDATGCRQEPILSFFLERYAASYLNEMHAFIDSIGTDRQEPMLPTIHDAEMAFKLALCVQESLTAHRPIKVS